MSNILVIGGGVVSGAWLGLFFGLLVSLVTGLALAAPWPAGIELNYPKIGIKLVILLALGGLLGMGSARQKRTGEAVPRGMFYAAGLLSLTAAGLAVIW